GRAGLRRARAGCAKHSASAPPSRRGATAPHPERTSQRTSRSTRPASSPGSSRVSRSATRAGWSGGVATRPTVTTPRSGPLSGACPLFCAWSVIGNSRACFAVKAGRGRWLSGFEDDLLTVVLLVLEDLEAALGIVEG